MNKDKITKISIVAVILFAIFGFLIVKAANSITLSLTSSYSRNYLTSTSSKDTINGQYFNDNDLMVLHYNILDGFSKVENSSLKVKLTGLEKYDSNMINSCIKVLYPGDYTDEFQVAINYQNYLDYEGEYALAGKSLEFPDKFNIVVYSEMDGEEVVATTREVEITKNYYGGDGEVVLYPVDNSYLDVNMPYTFLEGNPTDGYTLDVVMGSWEDNKYYVFDYHIFDNSIPRQDIKSASTSSDFVTINSKSSSAPKATAFYNSKIDDVDLYGRKLVLQFDRKNSGEVSKHQYEYNLYLTDYNGNTYPVPLKVNYMQYPRFAYVEGLSNENLKTTALIKEINPRYKASEDGTLTLSFKTPFYSFAGLSILDSNFNEVSEDNFDLSGSSSSFEVTMSNLETGRYTLLLYANSYDNPANSYSFYYEKAKVTNVNTINVYGVTSQIKNDDLVESNDFTLNKSMDYIFVQRQTTIGNKTYKNDVSYIDDLGMESAVSKFDSSFKGLLFIDTVEVDEYIPIKITSGYGTERFTLHPTVSAAADFTITLTAGQNTIPIPQSGRLSVSLTPVIARYGKITDVPYSYKVLYGDTVTTYATVEKGADNKDTFYISAGAPKGDYVVKLTLDDYPDASAYVTITATDSTSTEDDLVLEITNGNKIKIPSKGNLVKVTLVGRITKNGKILSDNGTFELLNKVDGVSLDKDVLTVSSTAKEGDKVVVNFSYGKASTSKTFTLTNDASGEGEETGDITPTPTEGDDSKKTFASIVISGFDSDRSQAKVLTFSDNSGTRRVLTYKCYDSNGNEVTNPIIEIGGSNEANGILVEPDYSTKTISVYANGLYGVNKTFYINVTSNGSSILNLPVVAAKPDEYDCYIDFAKTSIVKNSSFSATGTFINGVEEELEVSLVMYMYDKNNKIIAQSIDTKKIAALGTQEFATRFTLPSDIKDVKIKAFFINGSDITKASKIYTYSRSITNRKEG